jgi:6-phosphogluconolactonase (cycloisomerase 2 family)
MSSRRQGWRANRGRDGVLDRCRVGQADADRPRQDEWLSPAHMLVDPTGKWAIVANYGNGAGSEGTSIAVFAIGGDGKLADTPKTFVPHVPKPKRLDPAAPPPKNGNPPTSHPHCVLLSPDSKFLFVAEKGFDEIVIYRFDAATGALTPNSPAAVEATKFGAAPVSGVWKNGSSCRLL